MVVTLTLNPSLDYVMDVPHYQSGTVNRAARTRLLPGGKGINVALMLSRLGTPARMLGFLGGAAFPAPLALLGSHARFLCRVAKKPFTSRMRS